MAVTHVGEIVNSADSATGFSIGAISGDDDFVEGTGALGVKASNTTVEFYTTTADGGGAGFPYDFSSGGAEEGYHMIGWFNTKTPINSTTGLTMIMGNGTDRGRWNVLGSGFYKGGFVTRVIDTSADFDTIAAGTWTTTGNPAQLSNVTQMGMGFTTITAIMGSFNNVQIDQFCVGLGLRIDGGSVGTPNTWEILRAADEDTAFFGWWSSSNGAIIGKGKAYIGAATGTATSVFTDSAFTVIFADERVATGFYEINTRGSGLDVEWELASISAANPTNARWTLTVQSDTGSFKDTNGTWQGSDNLVLNANSDLIGTTIINSNLLTLNSGTLTGCSFLSPNGAACVLATTLDDIIGCTFASDGSNHAVELNSIGGGSMSWDNTLTGYVAGVAGSPASTSSTGNEAIYVNVGSGTLTINVETGATVPSIRTAGATVNVVAGAVTLKTVVQDISGTKIQNARVFVQAATGGGLPFNDSVTITRTGTTATVAHTAHGLSNGDKVVIRGANQREYVGIWTISNVTTNTYDFTVGGSPTTPATGTILSTFVLISALTDINGEASYTTTYSVDQPIEGNIRKSSASPYFKTGTVVGSVSKDTGATVTVVLLSDE